MPSLAAPPPSATLATNERVQARIAAGAPVLHLGFGEAGLPVLPGAAERLGAAAGANGYGPVAGSPAVRESAAGYFERRGLPTSADRILVAPGSKALLYALLTVLPGDVVLPRPSWVSYAAQAALAGKRVLDVPIAEQAGGVPDPDALRTLLGAARARGREPGILVLTLPDNPTGTLAPAALVEEVCDVARAHGLLIVCDEIYRDLAYDPEALLSPAALMPEGAFVTNGLSKSMALGGWRIGFCRLPHGPLGAEAEVALSGMASEVWSSLAAPMQHVAAYVLGEPDEVREHVARSRRLHRLVTTAAHEQVTAAGALCRPPSGAFYLYPDLEPLRPALARRGAETGAQLAELLLGRHDVAVLQGEAFGDDPGALRFRMATSLLYGASDEQRWEALLADDPLALPWIADALERLGETLRALAVQRVTRP
jgi:aspartate aminotransferase